MTIKKRLQRRSALNRTFLYVANWLAPKTTGDYIAKAFLTPKRYARPEWEKKLIEKATRKELPTGRKVWIWGDKGPVVVLVHGWEGRGSQLGAFVEPLLAAGYQIVAWDGPAHGDSPGERTHLPEFSEALQVDLQTFENLVAVVAHSMGAAALIYAVEKGLRLNKAILIASPAQWASAVNSLLTRLDLRSATHSAVLKSLEKYVGVPVEAIDVESWERKNKTSLLLLHDEQDVDVPVAEFLKLQKAFPEAKGKLFSGLGHRKILRDAGVIAEVVSFIKEAA